MFEIGTSLKEARVRQRLEMAELETATKIRGKYLRALEDEQFDVLPAQTYVKGFLRAYAEYLGLDGQLYVDEYNSRYVPGEEEPPVRARRSSVRPQRHHRLEANVVMIAVSAIGIVTLLVFAAWKFGGPDSESASLSIPTSRPPAKTAQARQTARKPSLPRKRVKRVRPAKKPAPALQRASLLVVASRGRCWLEVRAQPGDRVLYSDTLEAGERKLFTARRIRITLGAPGNVDLTLNKRRVTSTFGSDSPLDLLATPKRITRAPA